MADDVEVEFLVFELGHLHAQRARIEARIAEVNAELERRGVHFDPPDTSTW